MQARVTRITASVGSWIVGSGTFSIRTSPAACMTVPRITRSPPLRRALAILLVGHVRAPADGAAALICLLDRDVSHEPRRGGSMPVVLAWLEEDAIAGS